MIKTEMFLLGVWVMFTVTAFWLLVSLQEFVLEWKKNVHRNSSSVYVYDKIIVSEEKNASDGLIWLI